MYRIFFTVIFFIFQNQWIFILIFYNNIAITDMYIIYHSFASPKYQQQLEISKKHFFCFAHFFIKAIILTAYYYRQACENIRIQQ